MSEIAPIVQVIWKDGAFVPATAYQLTRAGEYFEEGKRYCITEHIERSVRNHNHYFAALHDAWQNLPEGMSDDFATDEHLRKHALIATGYYDQRAMICESPAKAREFAAFCRPLDEFALISVCGPAVVVRTAQSQSRKAMGAKKFNESKQKVLAWVWDLVGVDAETGNREAGRAA